MKRIKQTNAEMWGIWDYCLGSESPLSLVGKIIFFPFWVAYAMFTWLFTFVFLKLSDD